jgi:signal transduction histidine kinase
MIRTVGKQWTGLLIVLGSAVPLILAIVLTVSSIQANAEANAQRHERVLIAALAGMAQSWEIAIQELEIQLNTLFEKSGTSPESLLELSQNHPLIRQCFIINPQGELQWPLQDSQRQSEQAFIYRSLPLFAAPWSPPGHGEESTKATFGWAGWYWQEGYQYFFWIQQAQGYLGLELNRSALLSRLLSQEIPLPIPLDERLWHRIELKEATGRVLQSWGGLPNNQGPLHCTLRISRSPIQDWHLDWYVADLAKVAGGNDQIAPTLGIGALLILAGMATALGFRYYRQDLALAGKRISFVNQVSHELKTPLTNIRLYSEMLTQVLADSPESPQGPDYLAVILRESDRLSRLIRNVLTFGRRDKQQSIHPRKAYLHEVLAQSATSFQAGFREKGFILEMALSPGPALCFDPDVVDQIAGNLLSNAEKYAISGGRVLLSCQSSAQEISFTVRDYGPGLPLGYQRYLFQPFTRGHTRTTDAQGGTGLGLSISRDLAKQHGGDLLLLDTSNTGCHFCCRLKPYKEGNHENPSC